MNLASTLVTAPLDGPFGMEIRGVDLARPLDAETLDAIRFAFHTSGILLFRDQDLSPMQHIAFSPFRRSGGTCANPIPAARPSGDFRCR
jgi:alpha-ketoglutarate-dependent taurine dioxygenase